MQFAALSDNLGRVMVLDTEQLVVVHMWKVQYILSQLTAQPHGGLLMSY